MIEELIPLPHTELGVQTKLLEVLVCYDFHFRIFDEEEDMMFATELNMFSIGTIAVHTHTKPIPKLVYIPDIVIAEPVQNQHVKPVDVLVVKLVIPHDIVKQHLFETFFHLEVGEMIVNETLVQ
jgi:hypothetical protein